MAPASKGKGPAKGRPRKRPPNLSRKGKFPKRVPPRRP